MVAEREPQRVTPRPWRDLDWGWSRTWLHVVAVVATFVLIVLLVRQHFDTVEAWLSDLGPLAPLVFIAVHAVVVAVGFPLMVLSWLAGATFGFPGGVLVLMLGTLLTGSLIFGLSRYLLAGQVLRFAATRPRVGHFLVLAGQDSLRLMVLLRLSPLHFGLVSYLAGASHTRFLPYLAAIPCVLPSVAIQVYIGHTARVLGERVRGGDALQLWEIAVLASGILASVVLVWLLGRLAKRALEHRTDEQTAEPA